MNARRSLICGSISGWKGDGLATYRDRNIDFHSFYTIGHKAIETLKNTEAIKE